MLKARLYGSSVRATIVTWAHTADRCETNCKKMFNVIRTKATIFKLHPFGVSYILVSRIFSRDASRVCHPEWFIYTGLFVDSTRINFEELGSFCWDCPSPRWWPQQLWPATWTGLTNGWTAWVRKRTSQKAIPNKTKIKHKSPNSKRDMTQSVFSMILSLKFQNVLTPTPAAMPSTATRTPLEKLAFFKGLFRCLTWRKHFTLYGGVKNSRLLRM